MVSGKKLKDRLENRFKNITSFDIADIEWGKLKDDKLRCPFYRICPRLRKELKGKGIYGFCDFQPQFQIKCKIYESFAGNPSYNISCRVPMHLVKKNIRPLPKIFTQCLKKARKKNKKLRKKGIPRGEISVEDYLTAYLDKRINASPFLARYIARKMNNDKTFKKDILNHFKREGIILKPENPSKRKI